MHAELTALCQLFHLGEISDEEWALLQVHMAYCEGCHQAFLQTQQDSSANKRVIQLVGDN